AGLVASVRGWGAMWAFAFPLAYLLFAVPLPDEMAGAVTVPLRRFVTWTAAAVLRAAGVAVLRDGNVLRLSSATLEVADACSGIRSLWVMLAAAAGAGWFLGLSRPRLGLVCALGAALALAGNVLRVLATAALVVWAGPGFAQGTLHEAVGLAAFAASGAALLWLAWLLAPGTGAQAAAAPVATARLNAAGAGRARAAAAGVTLALGALALAALDHHYSFSARNARLNPARLPLTRFPAAVGDFAVTSAMALSDAERDMLDPTEQLRRVYQSPEGGVEVVLMYWQPGARGRAHSPDACMAASGWDRDPAWTREKPLPALPSHKVSYRLWRLDQRQAAMAFWLGQGLDWLVESGASRGWADRWRALVRSWHGETAAYQRRYYVRLLAPVRPGASPEEAFRLLDKFAGALAPLLPQYGLAASPPPK
ncbi:MAG TPA: exosortase-associated EpsI family protein, partial [Candidatus Brocadiia bacterium]|nr:exosortase-associated EpsI family protein [Candidatus Brocadiia bacterium]